MTANTSEMTRVQEKRANSEDLRLEKTHERMRHTRYETALRLPTEQHTRWIFGSTNFADFTNPILIEVPVSNNAPLRFPAGC